MKNLRYVCVQPRLLYYAWQVEVMINNFIKHGISGNDIDILVAWNPNDLTSSPENIEMWNKLANKYNYVRFFFYQDTREDMSYIPSIYFNILKQHIIYINIPILMKRNRILSNKTLLLEEIKEIIRSKNFSSLKNEFLLNLQSYHLVNKKIILVKYE